MITTLLVVFPHWFGISMPALSPGARAIEFKCEAAKWVSPPVVENKRFKGELSVTCVTEGGSGRGVVGLYEDLFDREKKEPKTIHAGPTPDKLDGLPAEKFEVTREDEEEKQKITVRSLDWIATDGATLKFRSQSVSVSGTGNMQYIRYLGGDYEVTQRRRRDPITYTVKLKSRTEVAQPWFAPTDLFLSEAKKQGMKTFEKRVKVLVPLLGSSL